MERPISDPISWIIDVKELGAKGVELEVAIVNEGEQPLMVKRAEVDIHKDGTDYGIHPVFLQGTDAWGRVRIGQFEIAHGRCHLPQDIDHRAIDFNLSIDYRYGDHEQTQRITRHHVTRRMTAR